MLEHYSIEKLPIIGHSEGASNTVAFAATHPQSVTSIILIEHAPELDFAAMAKSAPPNAIPVPVGTNFGNWQEVRKWQVSQLPGISEDSIKRRLHSRFVERGDHIEWREDPNIVEYKKNNPISGEERWSILRQVRCRTLFLLSSDSNLITDETAEKAANTVPDGTWLRTPNTGHNLFEDNPTDAIKSISEYLTKDPTAKTN